MKSAEYLFWFSFAIVFYSFIGYGVILWVLVKIKSLVVPGIVYNEAYQPDVTLVVPCYNEADVIDDKIRNSMLLDYPEDKLSILFITDGSTDNSRAVIEKYPNVNILHIDRRGGKTAAENRAMQFVKTPVVIFTDANTLLNTSAVKNIVRHFENEEVGCVSGEKRVLTAKAEVASAAGEGLYWKYESFLKKLDSDLHSAVGAAGELVSFRTSLYHEMPEDTLLDDFIQSMNIAAKGYRIVYEPDAYAVETASASVKEELKRKIRISAGGWQSIARLTKTLSFSNTPVLWFQYVSHRVLRWTINPFLLILIFSLNIPLLFNEGLFFKVVFLLQTGFYAAAFTGYLLAARKMKIKVFFVPYYFCVMNYAVVMGLRRFLKGGQTGIWEKAARMQPTLSAS